MLTQTGMADVYTDQNGMAKLKNQARTDPKAAIRETSRQFESVFLQMTLKSMRQANAAGKSELSESKNEEFFRDMYDQQLAVDLGKHSGLGLADRLAEQLGGGPATPTPAGGGKNLDSYRAAPVPHRFVVSGADTGNAVRRLNMQMLTPGANATTAAASGRTFEKPEDFVNALWPHAREAAAEIGADPKILIAQAALETGWGRSVVRTGKDQVSHNLFGIKADRSWNGQRVTTRTLEYTGDIPVQTKAAFRAYSNYGESFKDYVNFLKSNPRYSKAIDNAHNPHRFMASLQKAGYASDPAYARKVLSLYRHDALNKLTA